MNSRRTFLALSTSLAGAAALGVTRAASADDDDDDDDGRPLPPPGGPPFGDIRFDVDVTRRGRTVRVPASFDTLRFKQRGDGVLAEGVLRIPAFNLTRTVSIPVNIGATRELLLGDAGAKDRTIRRVSRQGPVVPILRLVLGPLFLNLLGLVITIPLPIIVTIDAVTGPGNLLGNLLAAIANLLNPGGGIGGALLANILTNLLNGILAILRGSPV